MTAIYTIHNHELGVVVNVFRERDDYSRYIAESRLAYDMNFIVNRETHEELPAAYAAAFRMANEDDV